MKLTCCDHRGAVEMQRDVINERKSHAKTHKISIR